MLTYTNTESGKLAFPTLGTTREEWMTHLLSTWNKYYPSNQYTTIDQVLQNTDTQIDEQNPCSKSLMDVWGQFDIMELGELVVTDGKRQSEKIYMITTKFIYRRSSENGGATI